MEGISKKDNVLKSRKNEARGLLKRCFKNPRFSLVPFEIWRDIVCQREGLVVCRLAQTCWGFKELVDNLRELLLEYALKHRKEDKIPQAKNLIVRCAEIGNSRAMLHIGYAYWSLGGWGLKEDAKKGVEWFKKAAELGNVTATAFYAKSLCAGVGIKKDAELSDFFARQALSSNDPFAIGYCHESGLVVAGDDEKASEYFKLSAEEGDEFGQNWYGRYFNYAFREDLERAFYWYLKSAEQGFADAQNTVRYMLERGIGCEKNEELSKIWNRKALSQFALK